MNRAELLAALAAATGPDRALDWAIHCRSGLEGVGMYSDCPRYTASIDAAMSLVPAGSIWEVFSDWPGDVYWAVVTLDDWLPDGKPNEHRSMCCESPALALCIAALTAQSAS